MEDDDNDAIDIEFHDVSFHSGIHLRNQFDYNLAALGNEAVVFASQIRRDTRRFVVFMIHNTCVFSFNSKFIERFLSLCSKLMCLHFSSSDNNKEWSVDMPHDEEVTGLAIGTGWLAAATDINRLRIFSVGGFQKDIVEVGGQIIAISGHEDLLFVTYHNGIGKLNKHE